MTELSDVERKGEIAAIRAKLKSKPDAVSSLNKAIITALSDAGIKVDSSISSSIVIALADELSDNLNNVTLPGGTNC